jgi:hypothetical protein
VEVSSDLSQVPYFFSLMTASISLRAWFCLADNCGIVFMCLSFLPSIFPALILSETVEHCHSPYRPPDNASDRAPNPMMSIVGDGQNNCHESRENERNCNLALYEIRPPGDAEFGVPMLFSCVTVISADATLVFGGLLLVPFDQGAKPLQAQPCKRYPPHLDLLSRYLLMVYDPVGGNTSHFVFPHPSRQDENVTLRSILRLCQPSLSPLKRPAIGAKTQQYKHFVAPHFKPIKTSSLEPSAEPLPPESR